MAVTLRSRGQIAKLRNAGRLVAQTYEVLEPHVRPGVSTAELDRIAEEFIRGKGATPMYKGYGGVPGRGRNARPPFPATICAAVNDVICHGIPSPKEILCEGDIVGIDIGVLLDGWIGDACKTFPVGKVDADAQRLIDVTRRCLELGIEQARPGNRMGDIGAAIQEYAEKQGFSVVREYHGHGVGRELWEEPVVLHWGAPGTGLRLQPGLVFTIEPMINEGRPETRVMSDRWTVRTADRSRSAQFEHSLAITQGAPEILTTL
jgi:methionyl aminopeptidase